MAQLNYFNGGLSTRLAQHLIQVNEATTCVNVDITSSTLKPLKQDKDMNIVVNKNIIFFKNTWVSSNDNVDYVIFQDKLYRSGSGIPQKSSDGIAWYNLGIARYGLAPTLGMPIAGSITGTYRYSFTYYNINDGTESAPSDYSNEISVTNQNILINLVASVDPQVTNIRIYRLGGTLTTMSLVATVTNTTQTYTDNLVDTAIPGDILTSQNAGQAPAGLQYLTKSNAMFFGTVSDKLYFSEVAFVNNWSPYYFIDYDEPITGLGATQNGLLVFTEYSTYLVTGTTPETLSSYLLSSNQGCIKHKSIKFLANTLMWLSHDGLCASTGTDIQVITRPKLGKVVLVNPKSAAVYDDVYYLAYEDYILCADFRFGLAFYMITGDIDSFHVASNKLWYSAGGKLYSMFEGSRYRELTYTTAEFPDGAISTIKNYKNLYAYGTQDMTVNVIIDGKQVGSYNLVDGVNDLKFPQTERRGYSIQFAIIGIGELKEIEYKVEGRQNGR